MLLTKVAYAHHARVNSIFQWHHMLRLLMQANLQSLLSTTKLLAQVENH